MPNFNFYEGPPTANGMPHIGHLFTRSFKDVILRFKKMSGFEVLKKAGFDAHGLPVELEVERKLGISGKKQIETFGIEKFTKECKKNVFTYKTEWEKITKDIECSIDLKNPYLTSDNRYIESVWWAIKQIWNKGLIYKDQRVAPYCPRCQTCLSSHELAQGYKNITEDSIIVKFKIRNKENEFFLVWTTTPWTLPSNVALILNPELEYAFAKFGSETYVLAKNLINSVLGQECEILKILKGIELKDLEYEPLFNYAKFDKKAHLVVCDDYVKLEEGTGIVHGAPAFGEDDARVIKNNNLAFINLIDEHGKFKTKASDFAGIFIKDADALIIENLKKRNLLFKVIPHTHSYPFCWRCDTSLFYYSTTSWFVAVTKVKDQLIANNNSINWHPGHIKKGRFGNFLENVVDWNLSRQRYWGTPLPIWECASGHLHCVGSLEELKNMAIDFPSNEKIDLHIPNIDKIHLRCNSCGQDMKRVKEVIDCWFDSGSMPFSQYHYPFENVELFENSFPADFISEAIDQTRGWFYTLLVISSIIFGKSSYKNVVVLGHVLDKNGIKMSKHKGNCVDPFEIIKKFGADSVRWYFYSNSAPWLPAKFSEERLFEIQKKFLNTLSNTYSFYKLYSEIDKFTPSDFEFKKEVFCVSDLWILSKINKLKLQVSEHMNGYRVFESTALIEDFVEELSNSYIRQNRKRFWSNKNDKDKQNAYTTLSTVLVDLSKICAPFLPHISEEIYQNVANEAGENFPKSVHLCEFPIFNPKVNLGEIEEKMQSVFKIINLGRICRNKSKIKIRQPLGTIHIKCPIDLENEYLNIILDELNIKKAKKLDESNEFIKYKIKPQLRTLGRRFGKELKSIFEEINSINTSEIVKELEKNGKFVFEYKGHELIFEKSDFLIETESFNDVFIEGDGEYAVVLDTTLTDLLVEEGYVREFISKVQNIRKTKDFHVLDKINIKIKVSERLGKILTNHKEEIAKEILAFDIDVSFKNLELENKDYDYIDINDEKVMIKVSIANC